MNGSLPNGPCKVKNFGTFPQAYLAGSDSTESRIRPVWIRFLGFVAGWVVTFMVEGRPVTIMGGREVDSENTQSWDAP